MTATSPLRLRRITSGLTQAELAHRAQVSQQLLSKIEQGARTLRPDMAQTLAKALGCRPAELLPELALTPQPDTENTRELELLELFRRNDERGKETALAVLRLNADPA